MNHVVIQIRFVLVEECDVAPFLLSLHPMRCHGIRERESGKIATIQERSDPEIIIEQLLLNVEGY